MAAITVKDVAELAGVSVATVSRVMNSNRPVAPELRERVLAAAKTLKYRPNRLARSLRKQLSQFIALVIPDIKNPFFSAVAHEIEEIAFQKGYCLLTCNTNDDPEIETAYFEILSDEAVSGIIICTVDERQAYHKVNSALECGIVVIAIDRRLENTNCDLVLSDNFGGARMGISHVIELGHQRIGLITGGNQFAPGRERRMGYEQALFDHNLPIDPELIFTTNFRDTGAEVATKELLNLRNPPTAIFVSSGNSAIGVLRAVNELHLKIPDDISLLMFDSPDWSEVYNPSISAIAQDARQIGATALDLLLQRLSDKERRPEERRVPTQLHIRHSVKDLRLSQALR